MDKFKYCLDTLTYKRQIDADLDDAARAGLRGTPTYFINNKRVEGVQSEKDWDLLIEAAR